MSNALLERLQGAAFRTVPPVEDPDTCTAVGEETGGPDAEAIWRRLLDIYRSGVHPGIQLCVRHRGSVVLDRAVGYARGIAVGQTPSPPDAVPMNTGTPVNLFSAAKAITSVVMHKLEGDGILALNNPVAAYLPEFARHGKGRITLHQVIDHRAGLPVIPPEALDLDLLTDPDAIQELVCDLHPRHKPGAAPAYHTVSGGLIMELVVRQVTGLSLRDILARDFKKPLGLQWFDYGVDPADVDRVAQNIATGMRPTPLLSRFLRRALGMNLDQAVELSNDPRFLTGVIPSANLIATARDVSALYQCIMDGGTLGDVKIMDRSTVAKLTHVPNTRLEVDRILGVPMRYGNGFMMGTRSLSLYGWNQPHAFGHVGLTNTFTWANPDRDLVVALLTTGKPVLGPHVLALPRLVAEIHDSFPVTDPGVVRWG